MSDHSTGKPSHNEEASKAGKGKAQSKKAGTKFQWTQEEAERPERTIVIVPDFSRLISGEAKQGDKGDQEDRLHVRSIEARMEEAVGLARAISLDVVESIAVPLKSIRPATLFGKGKVEELGLHVGAQEAGLAIVDASLSPVQQQNLEKAWNCKVLDRTGLILEIFGERARTKEGRLQVELAHLNYQKGRLVRSWTHLERQRGGLGFIGGPGETQIEADRRQIQEKITRLEKELEKVRRTRDLHRAKRKKVPYPVVALVGYTNAGKSTLFNKLTGAGVFAKDLLFATLDPTLRQLELPQGTKIILSDTVGFVSNLPTHLVAAFRATLEEVIEADLIIHVRDIADEDSAAQREDVIAILKQLGINSQTGSRIIEVWNKIDLLDEATRNTIRTTRFNDPENAKSGNSSEKPPQNETNVSDSLKPLLMSAITGEGEDALLERIENIISKGQGVTHLHVEVSKLSVISKIYELASVLDRTDNEDGSVGFKIRANHQNMAEINRHLKGK